MADHSIPRAAADRPRLSPQAAYAQWVDACTSAGWRGVPAAEQVPVWDGLDRVTAAPVHARWPAPRFACAAMDGIAITAGPGGGKAHSGGGKADADSRWRLAAASFAWVDTGDLIPAGMDTVIERERVKLRADGSAEITGPAPRGLHVRAQGEDFPAGQLLIPAGHRLRPADLATAAAAGHATLEVARQPVAAIIPTGDEVRPIGSALKPGDIVDSNSLMLALRAGQAGALAVISEVQPDDQDAIAAEVRRAALAADIVLVIAGSSAGRSDHAAAVLGQVGGLAVRGVAVRPGHPVLLGYAAPGRARASQSVRTVPVIGVPGYPLAAAVIFELFAVPLLAALQGREPPARAWQRVQLGCDWTSSPDVEDWVLVSLSPGVPDRDPGRLGGDGRDLAGFPVRTETSALPGGPAGPQAGRAVVATPSGRGAGAISRLMRANAWWPIPIGQGQFVRGEYIDVQPIPGP